MGKAGEERLPPHASADDEFAGGSEGAEGLSEATGGGLVKGGGAGGEAGAGEGAGSGGKVVAHSRQATGAGGGGEGEGAAAGKGAGQDSEHVKQLLVGAFRRASSSGAVCWFSLLSGVLV